MDISSIPSTRSTHQLLEQLYTFEHTTHVEATRTRTNFIHMQILAVNKAIGGEAAELFKRKNTLVVVALQGLWEIETAFTTLHSLSVPILAEFGRGSVEYTRTLVRKLNWRVAITSTQRINDTENRTSHVLMLGRDLSALWDMLNFQCAFTLPPRAYIVSDRGQPLKLETSTIQDAVTVEINPGLQNRCTAKTERDMLSALQSVGYHLTSP